VLFRRSEHEISTSNWGEFSIQKGKYLEENLDTWVRERCCGVVCAQQET
jgi:hypothetical protein